MSDASGDLERLISRYLDEEATRAERRRLRAALRRDPAAEALFEQYSTLDREVAQALKRALGRTAACGRPRVRGAPRGRLLAVSAAACLAAAVWLAGPHNRPRPSNRPQQARVGSWFAPAQWEDRLAPRPELYEEPHVGVCGTVRDWIVIPGQGPAEYLIVEVDRVRVHLVPVREDF